jgi:hypothetical protein
MTTSKPISLPQTEIKMGFEPDMVTLSLDQIALTKTLPDSLKNSVKFKKIMASIKEIGIIEPPAVMPDSKAQGRYIMLDGHVRLAALKELGIQEVVCLISTDDETFTYNKHFNNIATIQEHKMIAQAIARGVSEEKIARMLDLDVKTIALKRSLLEGICSETVDLLKDKIIASPVFNILRRMKDVRQIEAATLMNDANVYTISYAQALFAATPKDQLVNPEKPKKIKGLAMEQMERMESEMEKVQRDYRQIEESYGTDVLNLTLIKAWLAKLLDNARVARYLTQHHADILTQFQKIADMKTLNPKEAT